MQFMQSNKEGMDEYTIFGDDLYSTLRADVTKDDIDALENPFIKALANQLFAGTYNTDYRVADYQCYTPVTTLSDLWNAPGKYYDQRAGVTGINITKGKQAVVVSGIPENYSVQLVCTAWYEGHDGGNFDGGNPVHYTYLLRNGLNIIRYTFDYDALAYICYYADNAESMPDIKVHFINGQVNGYLSPEKTNKEMQTLCKNAKNICMDVLGKKVHSVWTSNGLSKYCLASDGKSLGYRQFMNVLDSLVQWEHRHLGLEKYNRIPGRTRSELPPRPGTARAQLQDPHVQRRRCHLGTLARVGTPAPDAALLLLERHGRSVEQHLLLLQHPAHGIPVYPRIVEPRT